MHKIIIVLLVLASIVHAAPSQAAVGFVPSTGMWFSHSEFRPGETIRVYTVIINNEYPSLEVEITLYDNEKIANKVALKNITEDTARQAALSWIPTEGDHTLAIRLSKVVVRDEQGNEHILNASSINGIAGLPLKIAGEQTIYPNITHTPLSSADTDSGNTTSHDQTTAGTAAVSVQRHNDGLRLAVPGSGVNASVGSPAQVDGARGDDPFAANRAIIAKAQSVAQLVTTTAGQVNNTYEKTKSVFEKSKALYNAGRDQASYIVYKVKRLGPAWNFISNHNDPRRLVIVGGSLLVAYWLARRIINRRRKRFRN